VFDIPAARTELPPGTPGAKSDRVGVSGRNSRGEPGYMGPCPPSGTHRYFFRLFALDVKTLGVPQAASRERVEEAMTAHTLATAELMGRYKKR
jgi:Raf kinase inhibitor-like YbhB/YbcL family protein